MNAETWFDTARFARRAQGLLLFDESTECYNRVRKHQLEPRHVAYWDDALGAWVPVSNAHIGQTAALLGPAWTWDGYYGAFFRGVGAEDPSEETAREWKTEIAPCPIDCLACPGEIAEGAAFWTGSQGAICGECATALGLRSVEALAFREWFTTRAVAQMTPEEARDRLLEIYTARYGAHEAQRLLSLDD